MSQEKSLKDKANDLIGKLTTFLSKDEPAEIKMAAEAAKQDGTKIYTEADDFTVGATVFVEDGEGYKPAEDGEHTLEDGRVIVVSDGVVAEDKAPEGEGEEMEEEHSFVTHEQFEQKLGEFATLIADAIGLSKDMAEKAELSEEKVAELETNLSKIESEKEALEAKLKEAPAAKSVKKEAPKATVQKLSAAEWAKASAKFRMKNPELNPHK